MNVNNMFSSDYLKAGDLQGRAHKVTIDRVEQVTLGQGADAEEKPALFFAGKDKGMILNKTNARMIAAYHGDESDEWAGHEIEIYPDKTEFKGSIVDCLRVRCAQEPPPAGADDGAF